MSVEAATIKEQLNLGIAAARAGRSNEAQSHLTAVIGADPQNIPAMFWLAFVVPTPQESVRLLEHVLTLDPTNERAKAGLRWAKARLNTVATPPEPQPVTTPTKVTLAVTSTIAKTVPSPASPRPAPAAPVTRPQQPVSSKPRRSAWPRLAVALSVGVLALLVLTLGALLIVPPDTLAAWWPRSTDPVPVIAEPAITFVAPKTTGDLTTNRLASVADTLSVSALDIVDIAPSQEVQIADTIPVASGLETDLVLEEASKPVVSNVTLAEEIYATLDPALLIGPDIPAVVPVENLLLAHQPATPDEKWIEVNVTTQQITAWEGTKPVFTFTGSTGLPNTPTVLGEFNIYWKLESTLMTGPGYYLPEVPYTMYFYAGYALHGAYWHNNFGQPMSHGCVNLETGDAKKLFEWATPLMPPGQTQVVATADNLGTLVVVHE